MDHPRNYLVFGIVFILLAVLPVIPVIYISNIPDQAPQLAFLSYIQILRHVLAFELFYRVEWYSLMTFAGLLVIGILISKLILHQLESK
jgi:hypothetical protein